jgi:aarF domain-containing kinase
MLRTAVRRSAITLAGTSTIGATGAALYASTEEGSGFRREVQFWSRVFPVIADYYVRTAQSSPLTKYERWVNPELDKNEAYRKRKRSELLNTLHERHAPAVLQVMLDLKGLYVKLGQVLSVTALPIPEQYRKLFRTLQSNVPGHEDFNFVVKPTLEKEFGKKLDDIFEYIDPIPCGAASIGQAHRARLKPECIIGDSDHSDYRECVVKVQYPSAAVTVPADIKCVGDVLKICVWAGIFDEASARLSFDEFSRQFLAELDYDRERQNLKTVHDSSLDPSAPYLRRNIVVPAVFNDFCTKKVITMTYLPGPKLEEEAKRQLEMLGIDTSAGIAEIIRNAAKDASDHPNESESGELVRRVTQQVRKNSISWKLKASNIYGRWIGFDSIFWAVRVTKRLILWSQAFLVTTIQAAPRSFVSSKWQDWVESHRTAAAQAARLSLTEEWITGLFDVHGHQVFNLGLFNADPHPGNILVIEEEGEKKKASTELGLIDYGQCKQLTPEEQYKIAKLMLSVANNEDDESIANAFRDLEIVTKNDSTEFLAKFGKLMFGPFQAEHMNHSWHMKLHEMDKVLYFPKELSMVYRTSLLLRGLAVSLQLNYSIGDQWKHHAEEAMNRIRP